MEMIVFFDEKKEGLRLGIHKAASITIREHNHVFVDGTKTPYYVIPAAASLFFHMCAEAISEKRLINIRALVDMANNPPSDEI